VSTSFIFVLVRFALNYVCLLLQQPGIEPVPVTTGTSITISMLFSKQQDLHILSSTNQLYHVLVIAMLLLYTL
jgi:hypothetical protein